MKEKLQQVRPHIALYRDSDTGLAWVEDGSAGIAYSPHPNTGGSGAAMKRRGAWDKNARTVRCRGFTYNIDQSVPMGDELDRLAATHCRCGGVHPPEAAGSLKKPSRPARSSRRVGMPDSPLADMTPGERQAYSQGWLAGYGDQEAVQRARELALEWAQGNEWLQQCSRRLCIALAIRIDQGGPK